MSGRPNEWTPLGLAGLALQPLALLSGPKGAEYIIDEPIEIKRE